MTTRATPARQAGPAGPATPTSPPGAARPDGGPAPKPVPRRVALGAYGERLAAQHLTQAGLVVLDRNWRCPEGEVDLVLRDGDDLVACEVKTRSSDVCGSPHEAVDAVKLERLHRLAWRWAQAHGVRPAGVRVDLVAVLRPRRGPSVVEHVRGLG